MIDIEVDKTVPEVVIGERKAAPKIGLPIEKEETKRGRPKKETHKITEVDTAILVETLNNIFLKEKKIEAGIVEEQTYELSDIEKQTLIQTGTPFLQKHYAIMSKYMIDVTFLIALVSIALPRIALFMQKRQLKQKEVKKSEVPS